jgi:hypothetical protein
MQLRRLLVLCLLSAACGDSEGTPEKAPLKSAPTETKVDVTPPPVAEEGGKLPEDPLANDVWTDDDHGDEAGTPVEPTPAPEEGPFPGPCRITYKNGPTLRFKYTATGGTVKIASNVEGAPDTCGKFERKDGHTTKVTVDLGCDKKSDLRIEPHYDPEVNVATAKITASDANGGNREITLVTLGAFTGLEPGFPIEAARKDVKLDVKDKRVQSASTDDVKLSLVYDKDGRIKTLKEDAGADGTVDRKFDYKFDKLGNVTRIDVATTPIVDGKPGKAVKMIAKLDYACWSKPAK